MFLAWVSCLRAAHSESCSTDPTATTTALPYLQRCQNTQHRRNNIKNNSPKIITIHFPHRRQRRDIHHTWDKVQFKFRTGYPFHLFLSTHDCILTFAQLFQNHADPLSDETLSRIALLCNDENSFRARGGHRQFLP